MEIPGSIRSSAGLKEFLPGQNVREESQQAAYPAAESWT